MHDIARFEGPERIAPEWWRPGHDERPTRDYHRLEDVRGRRFWVFRNGLHDREREHPRWFVHGLFDLQAMLTPRPPPHSPSCGGRLNHRTRSARKFPLDSRDPD